MQFEHMSASLEQAHENMQKLDKELATEKVDKHNWTHYSPSYIYLLFYH